MQQIYEFLTVIIWNNHEAKMDFVKSKNIAISHLKLNYGALEFLKELYTNVKPLLLNQSEIIRVCTSVLKVANSMPNDKQYQSKLVHFLRSLVILNDRPIKINQGIIFQEIQSCQYNDSLQIFDIENEEDVLENLPIYIKDYEKQFDHSFATQKLSIHSNIMYVMSIFSLFSLLVEGQNQINLRKSRKLHPFYFLVSIMEKSSVCIPLKKEIRGYMNRVYYNQSNFSKKKSHIIRTSISQVTKQNSNPFDEASNGITIGQNNQTSNLQQKVPQVSQFATPRGRVSLLESMKKEQTQSTPSQSQNASSIKFQGDIIDNTSIYNTPQQNSSKGYIEDSSTSRINPLANLSIIPEDQENTFTEKRNSDGNEYFQNNLKSFEQTSGSSTPVNRLTKTNSENVDLDSPLQFQKVRNLSMKVNNPSSDQDNYQFQKKQALQEADSNTSDNSIQLNKPSSALVLSSENLKSLQDINGQIEQTENEEENYQKIGSLEQVKEEYENEEEEISQITVDKRQKAIQNNRQSYKREINSNFFNEMNMKDSDLVQGQKKSLFLKDGMIYDVIKDLNFIASDLNEYIYILQNIGQFENVEIENYLRFKYFKSYVILNFKEIIYSLYFLFSNTDFVSLLKVQLDFILKQKDKSENPHAILLSLVNSLITILKINNYLHQPIRYIIRKLYTLIKSFDFKALQQKEQYTNMKFGESVMFSSPYRVGQKKYLNYLVFFLFSRVSKLRIFLNFNLKRNILSKNVEFINETHGESMLLNSINNTTMINTSISFTQEIRGSNFEGIRDSFISGGKENQGDQKQLLKSIKSFVRLYDQSNSESKILSYSHSSNKKSIAGNYLQDDLNEQLNNQLKLELYILDNSKYFQDQFKRESDKLFQMKWKEEAKNDSIPEVTSYDLEEDCISKKNFIQSILDTAISNQNLPDDLHIFYLNILIRMIKDLNTSSENHQFIILITLNQQDDQEIDVWETSEWKDHKDEIERMQTLIYSQGGAKLICSLLKQPNLEQRLNLVSHILLFGISLLLGGHRKTQNRILFILKEDTENLILINLNTLIQKIGKIVYRFSKESIKVKQLSQLNLVDTYDYYDNITQTMVRKSTTNPDDYKEDQFKGLCIEVLKRIFRFLQLCCENNNIDMKNYLRTQTYGDKRYKPNTINFIQVAAELNREFLKIMNNCQ